MGGTALSLRGISKLFGTFRALDQVDMQIERGTVHAILGENGAGKTTLMNILFGLYQPEEGQIFLNGKEAQIPSPKLAMDMGIGMIHQHFMLVDSLTVAENVALGLPGQGLKLDLEAIAARLAELSAEYEFDIDPHQEVWKLPIGMRQRVEILKVLFRDADIIILDEPTSVLAPNEIASFLDGLRRLRAQGKTVIFITHKLDEVEAVADNVTILQHGRVSAELKVAESDAKEMARLMVGREVVHDKMDRGDKAPGEVIFRAEGLRARDQRGIEALKGVTIEIRAGEVLGIAGVDGNGQAGVVRYRIKDLPLSLVSCRRTLRLHRTLILVKSSLIQRNRLNISTLNQSIAQSLIYKIMYKPCLMETHFVLSWVNINVNLLRINFNKEHISSELIRLKTRLVTLANRMINQFVSHHTTIDVAIL